MYRLGAAKAPGPALRVSASLWQSLPPQGAPGSGGSIQAQPLPKKASRTSWWGLQGPAEQGSWGVWGGAGGEVFGEVELEAAHELSAPLPAAPVAQWGEAQGLA